MLPSILVQRRIKKLGEEKKNNLDLILSSWNFVLR